MKAAEVLNTLGISRATLHRYTKKGIIKTEKLPTGHYVYNDESVKKLKKKLKSNISSPLLRTAIYLPLDKNNTLERYKTIIADASKKDYRIFIENTVNKKFLQNFALQDLVKEILKNRINKVFVTSKNSIDENVWDFFDYICAIKGIKIMEWSKKNA